MGGIYVDFSVVNQLNSPALNSNIFANRPAAGQIGRLFISTDTFEIYRDNGATWDLIGGPGTSTITGTGTAGTLPIFTAAQAIGDSSLLEGATSFTTTKDFQVDALYLNGMTLGSGALYYSGNRLTLANYNPGGDVMIEANGGAFAQFISGADLSTTFYGNIIRNGGLSTQFLMADGSLNSASYVTDNIYTANGTLAGARTVNLNNHNLRFEGGANVARLRLSANNNIARIFSFATADVARWAFRVDGNETGSNAGADFAIRRYDDTGALISTPFRINRQTGNVGVGNNLVQLETFNVTGSSLFNHNFLQAAGTNRKGIFSFLTTETQAGATFTNGMNYNAVGALHWNDFYANTTVPNTVTMGGSYNGAQVGFYAPNVNVTISQGSGGTLRSFSGAISQIGLAATNTGGVVSHVSAFHAYAPIYTGPNLPTITNYYGIILNDTTEYTQLAITNRWGIYQPGATDLNYFNGNVLIGSNTDNGNKLQVTGQATISGNVGIGVTPSAWNTGLKVQQIGNSAFILGSGSEQAIIGSNWFQNTSATNVYLNNGFATFYQQASGQHQWFTAPSGTAGNAISFTQAMTLDASGNLMVGGTSPTTKITLVRNGFLGSNTLGSATASTYSIDVRGNLSTDIVTGEWLGGYILDAYDSASATGNGRTLLSGMHFVAASDFSSSASSVALAFTTGAGGNATERLRITSGGNVLIGTTTDAGAKLYVNGSIINQTNILSTGDAGLLIDNNNRLGFEQSGVRSWNVKATSGNLVLSSGDNAGSFTFNASSVETIGSIKTASPTGGTAKPWKLGAVATVTPTAQNRTIEVEIDGTTYYITAKTTND